MKYKPLYFNALFLLMLVTGVFWGTWFTLTRSIEDFSTEEFLHIGKVIIDNVGVRMSILMPACILLMILSVWLGRRRKRKRAALYVGILSVLLIIFVLLVTLIVLVPIDNNIRIWTVSTVPQDWPGIRGKWNYYHELRTYASVASFVCFLIFTMSEEKRPGSRVESSLHLE